MLLFHDPDVCQAMGSGEGGGINAEKLAWGVEIMIVVGSREQSRLIKKVGRSAAKTIPRRATSRSPKPKKTK